MIVWLFVMVIAGALLGGYFANKFFQSEIGKAFGQGVAELLSGWAFLEMSSLEMMEMNHDWEELLEDTEFLYCFLRFAGVFCLALGIAMIAYALLQALEGVMTSVKRAAASTQAVNTPAPVVHNGNVPGDGGCSNKEQKESGSQAAALETVLVNVQGDTVICPKCRRSQSSSRKCCWECGTLFQYEGEAEV